MSLRERLGQWRLGAAQAPTAIETKDSAAVTSTLGGLGWPQPTLYAALGGVCIKYWRSGYAIHRVAGGGGLCRIRSVSQDMAVLKPFVRRTLAGGGYRRELQHPLNKLFRRPNRWQTRFEFISYMISSLCLRGNSYVVVERDKDANPIELVPIAPDRATIMLTEDGELWYRVNSRRIGQAS